MPVSGFINHIDISVGYPGISIPFYDCFFKTLGFERMESDYPEFMGSDPIRAWWAIKYTGGATFGVEVRPAKEASKDRKYDRYEPGPHHLAFHSDSADRVDAIYEAMVNVGAKILDPPTDYSGQSGYGEGYYAVFIADPEGVKLEVVYDPGSNP